MSGNEQELLARALFIRSRGLPASRQIEKMAEYVRTFEFEGGMANQVAVSVISTE